LISPSLRRYCPLDCIRPWLSLRDDLGGGAQQTPSTTSPSPSPSAQHRHAAVRAGLVIAGRMICVLRRRAVACRTRPASEWHGRIFWRASRSRDGRARNHDSPQSRLASRLALFPSTRLSFPNGRLAPLPRCMSQPRPYNAGAKTCGPSAGSTLTSRRSGLCVCRRVRGVLRSGT
jgi:hypothetical protein